MSDAITDDLVTFLVEILPEGWAQAAEAGDDGALRALRACVLVLVHARVRVRGGSVLPARGAL